MINPGMYPLEAPRRKDGDDLSGGKKEGKKDIKKKPSMSYNEWQVLSAEVNSNDNFFGKSEIKELLGKYGIELDSGMIEVEIDGENHLMDTSKNNFGVIDTPPKG